MCGFFPLIYVGIGYAMMTGDFEIPNDPNGPPPEMLGNMFMIVGGIAALFSWVGGLLTIVAGWMLMKHRGRTFCLIVAAFNCLQMPFGTILGIFALVVLLKPEVKQFYEQGAIEPLDIVNV